jgi:shikimate dehydrogenase
VKPPSLFLESVSRGVHVPKISGTTRLHVIVGSPIGQVRAPEVFNPMFEAADIDAVLVPLEIPPSEFEASFKALLHAPNVDSIVITVPFKALAFAHCDHVGLTGSIVKLVNVMRRGTDGAWYGDNFDGAGFVTGLRAAGFTPAGASVLVVGTGGAGAAITAELARAGAAGIGIFDIDEARARNTGAALQAQNYNVRALKDLDDISGYTLAINATPLGMKAGDPLPFDVGRLDAAALVAEVIMKPAVTALLLAAEQRGLKIHPGAGMLDGQTKALFAYMTSQPPGS